MGWAVDRPCKSRSGPIAAVSLTTAARRPDSEPDPPTSDPRNENQGR